jgi:hypothetical protein
VKQTQNKKGIASKAKQSRKERHFIISREAAKQSGCHVIARAKPEAIQKKVTSYNK